MAEGGKTKYKRGERRSEKEMRVQLGGSERGDSGWHLEECEKVLCQLRDEEEKNNHLQRK